MFDMGVEMMDLPFEEKTKYDQGAETGLSFGYQFPFPSHFSHHTHDDIIPSNRYKALGASATDETGARDRAEYFNISQDDALSYPVPTHRSYPAPVNVHMESTIAPFVRKSVEVNLTLMEVLNDKLGLPKGTLANNHPIDGLSGSEARCIKSPPTQEIFSEKASIGAHSDFGSLVS